MTNPRESLAALMHELVERQQGEHIEPAQPDEQGRCTVCLKRAEWLLAHGVTVGPASPVRDPAPPDWKDVGSDGEKPLWDALSVGFRAVMAAGQMLETMDDSALSLAAYNAEIDKWNYARSTIVKLYRAVRGVRDPSPPTRWLSDTRDLAYQDYTTGHLTEFWRARVEALLDVLEGMEAGVRGAGVVPPVPPLKARTATDEQVDTIFKDQLVRMDETFRTMDEG